MDILRRELAARLARLPDAEAVRVRAAQPSCFPFNATEYVVTQCVARGVLSLEEYEALRGGVLARNPNLPVFEIGGLREFGEQWAQRHVAEFVPALTKPTRLLDPNYDGEYDLLFCPPASAPVGPRRAGRVEIKAVRIARGGAGTLSERALRVATAESFQATFAQVKPECCDALVLLAVWADACQYWVVPAAAITGLAGYSATQHRGNVGEGQIRLTRTTLAGLAPFATAASTLDAALAAALAAPAGGIVVPPAAQIGLFDV